MNMEELARESIDLARQEAESGCLNKSFELYVLAFEKCAGMKDEHESEFRAVLSQLNELLASANKMEDIFKNFKIAMEIFPNNIYYLNDIGKYLYKYAFYSEARWHFQKALSIDSTFVSAEKNLNSVKNLLVERWHFRMLNDKIRNYAYREALHQVVIPFKDSVLDIGTGTGLLAMYANECTPIIVTGCDSSETMARIADIIIDEHNLALVNIVNKMSTSMNFKEIPGKRSVLVTEMFDAGLLGEHILQTVSHAFENLLGKNPKIIPGKAEFFVIGAKCDYLNHKYQLSADSKALLKVGNLNVHMLTDDETYDCEDVHLITDIKYMTEPQSVVKVDLNSLHDIQDKLARTDPYEIALKAVDNGEINIMIGWFNLYLTDKITITTDPRSDKRANAWQQAVFFDNIPKLVKENDILNIDFLINGGKLTILQEDDDSIDRISPEIIRFLNDSDYMKMITGCIGMACVYLGQIAEMSESSIIDLCPFPLFGLQLLKRGARDLICYAKSSDDKDFLRKVFEANDIPPSKVTILVGGDLSDDGFADNKYHAIFFYTFDLCGDIFARFNELGQHLKQAHLVQGGLFMPAKVNLIGQLVSSHWLDINNKVYDENVNNYKIAKHINKYQVSQNFCIDFTHLEYTALTEPVVLGNCNSTPGSEVVNLPVTKDGLANALLCWYSIELMEDMNEISTNRRNSFIDGTAFLANPEVSVVHGKSANVLRCMDPDGSFKFIINLEAT